MEEEEIVDLRFEIWNLEFQNLKPKKATIIKGKTFLESIKSRWPK
jgi:hypothetical protein